MDLSMFGRLCCSLRFVYLRKCRLHLPRSVSYSQSVFLRSRCLALVRHVCYGRGKITIWSRFGKDSAKVAPGEPGNVMISKPCPESLCLIWFLSAQLSRKGPKPIGRHKVPASAMIEVPWGAGAQVVRSFKTQESREPPNALRAYRTRDDVGSKTLVA